MLGDECLELGHELGVLPEREVGVDPSLDRQQVQILQAHDRRLRERLEGEIREGRPAPEPESLAQQPGSGGGIGGGGLLEETLEASDVELLRVDPDDVAGRDGREERRAGAERLAQPRDARLQRRSALVWSLPRPELLDQPVGGDDLVRMEEQEREQATLPRAGQRERDAVVENLQRAEDPELQAAFRGRLPAVSEL